eukprot:CAMPEP_0181102336 /NCGR_PEP_ID=MMETSP1071-20121207/14261_1 /TAXON_ID=35127 /ORGANISM="Thalassiosira sp., Strain NH16" /LENGTH=355 /DNA_ID=CAMNT_0023185303 /DNA_START=8 /DNA_END=1075 /DNA_ORIENTATION=+
MNPHNQDVTTRHSEHTVEWGGAVDAAIWEILISQVRAQLRASTPGECFSRALELQVLARSEVGHRSQRLECNDMDLMAVGQPILVDAKSSQQGSFVPISPIKPSRHVNAVKSLEPKNQGLVKKSLPTKSDGIPKPPQLPRLPLSEIHNSLPPLQVKKGTLMAMPNDGDLFHTGVHGNHCTNSDPKLLESFMHGVGNDTCCSGQPTNKGHHMGLIRVASTWSATRSPKSRNKKEGKPKKARSKFGQKKTKGTAKNALTGTTCWPREFDVLGGRGGGTNRHSGNVMFREEARRLKHIYQDSNTKKEEKNIISKELVQKVKGYGGRFLVPGDRGIWYEMDDRRAREKAKQALREHRWE